MNVAVLGLGFMGSTHVRAWKEIPGTRLTAVMSSDEKKLSGDFSDIHGNLGGAAGQPEDLAGVRKHRSVAAVLDDRDVDAVDICIPTDQHQEVVLAALRAGKHVLVEKPLALTFDVADALVREAEYRNRILMAGQVLRFFPAYRSMAAMLTNAEPVRSAFFRRRCGAPGWSEWLLDSSRSGGGVFDLLVHDADYCISLWGMPVSVRATGYQDLARGIDVIHAELNYPDVGPVIITGGWYHSPSYPFSMEFTIATDRRTLEFSSGGSDLIEYVAGGQETKHRLAEADPFTAELAYFADCVTHQRQPDFCPPQQSAQAVALMHFLLESREADGREITCAI